MAIISKFFALLFTALTLSVFILSSAATAESKLSNDEYASTEIDSADYIEMLSVNLRCNRMKATCRSICAELESQYAIVGYLCSGGPRDASASPQCLNAHTQLEALSAMFMQCLIRQRGLPGRLEY